MVTWSKVLDTGSLDKKKKIIKKCSCCIGWVEKNVLVTALGRPMYRNIHKNACSMSNLLPRTCFRHGGLPLPLIIHRLALGYWKGCCWQKRLPLEKRSSILRNLFSVVKFIFVGLKRELFNLNVRFARNFTLLVNIPGIIWGWKFKNNEKVSFKEITLSNFYSSRTNVSINL